jgi:hypothetical protein
MKHLLRKYETKHLSNLSCAEGALHGAKLRFIFHAPKVRFIATMSPDRYTFTDNIAF